MKMLTLCAVTALALALSAGTSLASSGEGRTRDDNFDVFLQSHGRAVGHRSFLSGSEDYRYYRAYPRHHRYVAPYYESERPYHWWFW